METTKERKIPTINKCEEYNKKLALHHIKIVQIVGYDRWVSLRFEMGMQFIERKLIIDPMQMPQEFRNDLIITNDKAKREYIQNENYWHYWNWSWSHEDIAILEKFSKDEILINYEQLKEQFMHNMDKVKNLFDYLAIKRKQERESRTK